MEDTRTRANGSQAPWYEQPVGKAILIGVAAVLLAVPIFIWAWFLAAAHQASLKGDPNMVKLVWLQNDFQNALEKVVGRPRRFSQTIRAYVSSHSTELGASTPEAAELADSFERLMFSGVAVGPTELKDMQARVKAVRGTLKKTREDNG